MTFANPSLAAKDRTPRVAGRRRLMDRLVDRALPTAAAGRLQMVLPDGAIIERNGAAAGPDAAITLRRWRGLWRMVRDGANGFAEGYLDGDWSTPALGPLLEFGVRNESTLKDTSANGWLNLARTSLLHHLRRNTRRASRRHIAAHYDLGNAFFGYWLDGGMNYSSALYAADETLEQAQTAKLDRAAALLELHGGEHILEIGCGWGAFAERLIRRYGAKVTGVTLSAEQLVYAKDRLAEEVKQGSADLRLQDYRDVAGRFPRVASIEMIEAVGAAYWPVYFSKLRSCLVDGGVALIQAITIDEKRYAAYRRRPDFIQQHVFPGGQLPTRSIIAREAAAAGLKLVHHQSFGDSYAKTLREWRNRFLEAWPKIEVLGFNDRFRRIWEYYLTYCEIGFRTGAIDVGFFKLAG